MTDGLEDLLRACTVRVLGGPMPGAGFFVAPGTVLTCVHVIGDGTSLTIGWERDGAAPVVFPVTGRPRVLPSRGRAIRNLDRDYPDVAVLTVEAPSGHPCVRMDLVRPEHGDRVLVFGYPEEGGSVHLTPAALTYRGLHGNLPTSFWDLGADTVKPGMSGAAALHLRTGGVGGIVVASKNPARADGALVVPWHEVAQDLGAVLAANRAFHEIDHRWNDATRSGVASSALLGLQGRDGPEVVGAPRVMKWVHGGVPSEVFVGRVDELASLDRWARDPQVTLIGVIAWGGAGKTALVTEWLTRHEGAAQREVRGVFAWSFYEVNSADAWAQALLDWVEAEFDTKSKHRDLSRRILDILTRVPLVVVIDGLEVIQDWSKGSTFGQFLDGSLRYILTNLCQSTSKSLMVLTSRFPFADVSQFDGGAARMLEVPPFSSDEGAAILRRGAVWLPESELRELSQAVDGHALAVEVLAGALASRPSATELGTLREELKAAAPLDGLITNARVAKVLNFYAQRISSADRVLISIIALFPRPVPADAILALGSGDIFGRALADWSLSTIERTVRQNLNGLLAWYGNETVSTHPLVRDAFRSDVLSPDQAREVSSVQIRGVPLGEVQSRDHALAIVEAIELLLEAGLWKEADALYKSRIGNGSAWRKLAVARLGQRCGTAFVATPDRMWQCADNTNRLNYYLNTAGLFGLYTGDLLGSRHYLEAGVEHYRGLPGHSQELAISLDNLAECFFFSGDAEAAHLATLEAAKIAAQAFYSRSYGRPSPELVVTGAYLGAALDLTGQSVEAAQAFDDANARMLAARGSGLSSMWAAWWGDFLLRTGREPIARKLSERVAGVHGSRLDIARSLRLEGKCDLASGGDKALESAKRRMQDAADIFATGDCLLELSETLVDLATCIRLGGELDEAERICREAIAIAQPRGQVPAHSRALSCRAWIRLDRFAGSADIEDAARARDDAGAARRLSTRYWRLPWHELWAAEAQAAVDAATGRGSEFEHLSSDLRAILLPPSLQSRQVVLE
jgi:tetratricopeptide (TPR) repeat protein